MTTYLDYLTDPCVTVSGMAGSPEPPAPQRPAAPELSQRYQQIINTPLPAFRENIRRLTRKEWSIKVKSLLKSIGLGWISVTAPNYSMASSIDIRFHEHEDFDGSAHEAKHREIDETERYNNGPWLGYNKSCPWCKQQWQAHVQLEKIILTAFPDLDNRSDGQSDYSDFCFSIA